ncbi:hypothetical protein ABH37_01665 [Mycobacterium haemophilum]|uniref:Uncharacterized protein n=1 Tax=Mycobacterium haemophilum TaxID=29311 RepID=A0A0I9TUW9_9MYCO|nr:hypothetical protein ABH39_01660 [Mycobacterium haemophilum]KLO39083.1 hypothetical protein ABH38_01665 [Mycobacterium haemophilum]KLO45497.1 hypothetical protein ABH37_01665 [Mycobacterium haemophilum]KLO56649.1 hypothetical protein ABH36_01660 [Mycobacterium haemophilum]
MVLDAAVEAVHGVTDGADVTDVNNWYLASRSMLAQLGANRYLRIAARRGLPPSAAGDRWAHLHPGASGASTSLLLTRLLGIAEVTNGRGQ